jgi:hypothetical protein
MLQLSNFLQKTHKLVQISTKKVEIDFFSILEPIKMIYPKTKFWRLATKRRRTRKKDETEMVIKIFEINSAILEKIPKY